MIKLFSFRGVFFLCVVASVLLASGANAGFVDIGATLPAISGAARWGDYDNDGDLDIAILGGIGEGDSYTSRILRNDGGEVFTNIFAPLTDMYAASPAWGDYDNDGDLDLALGGIESGPSPWVYKLEVYRNDGSDTFTKVYTESTGPYEGCDVAWGDYDNDGDLDIGVQANGGPTPVIRNDGSDTFRQRSPE